jgi:hypothetical protein
MQEVSSNTAKVATNVERVVGQTADLDFQTARARKKQDITAEREQINTNNGASSIPSEIEQVEPINHQLEIESFFWDRDSHGLFDFESRTLK